MPTLDLIKDQAIFLMQKSGFPIDGNVEVALDGTLPFMGDTTEQEGKSLIVVSEMALVSGKVMGLLVHELSHVYRTQTGHPSHNYLLVNKAINFVLNKKMVGPYQIEIIHNIVNHLQDLYADDITFNVLKEENLNEFFLSWVGQEEIEEGGAEKWLLAASLLSTSFAQANLERHKLSDRGRLLSRSVNEYLLKIDQSLAQHYESFKNLMVNLPEKISEENYSYLLKNYLNSFLKLT